MREGNGSTRLALLILLVGQAMASFDGSVAAVAAPAIRGDLHASGAALQLIVAGYTLTFAMLVVTGARLGADLGYRLVFRVGLALFTASSLLCGVAPTAGVLIGARLVQGAAGAVMLPQVLSLIQVLFDGDERDRAVGWYAAVLSIGVTAGQILGGALVSADVLGLSWRTVFLVNVPIGVLLLRSSGRCLPSTRAPARQPLDLPGVATFSVGVTLLLLPIMFGREQGWPAWVWLSAVGSAVSLGAFAALQRRPRSAHVAPLLDLAILRAPGVMRGLAVAGAVMGSYAGLMFCLTLHLQSGLGYSAVRAGLTITPYAVGFGTMSLLSRRMASRFQTALPVVGPVLLGGAAVAVIVAAQAGWPTVAAVPLLFAAGAGQAAAFGPTVARTLKPLAPAQAASATSIISTGSVLSQAFGVAVLGDVYLAAAHAGAGGSARALLHAGVVLGALLAAAAVVGATLVRPGPTRRAASVP